MGKSTISMAMFNNKLCLHMCSMCTYTHDTHIHCSFLSTGPFFENVSAVFSQRSGHGLAAKLAGEVDGLDDTSESEDEEGAEEAAKNFWRKSPRIPGFSHL